MLDSVVCKHCDRELVPGGCEGPENCFLFLTTDRKRLSITLKYSLEIAEAERNRLRLQLDLLEEQSKALLLFCTEQETILTNSLDRYSQGKVDALRSVALVIMKLRGEP